MLITITTKPRAVRAAFTVRSTHILHADISPSMPQMNQSRENIFEYLDQLYGSNCFANLSKAVKVRNFLYKYISSNCGYRKVVKHVIEDALDFFFRRHYGVADEKADVNTREALYIAAHYSILI